MREKQDQFKYKVCLVRK